jgi:hypothetical protein
MAIERNDLQRAASLVLGALSYLASLFTDPPDCTYLFALAALFLTYAIWPEPPDGEI